MNDTLKLLHERASCRAFADRDIPQDLLESVLEAGVRAPTGGNLQPYSVIVVREQATRERLAGMCGNQRFIARAPVDLLFCIDWHRSRRWARMEDAPFAADHSFRHFWISFQDTVICAQNICTAADSVGLGSCYVGTVMACLSELREMFNLPQGVFPVVLLSLGYPSVQLQPRPKFPQSIMVHYESYSEPTDEQFREALDTKYEGKTFELTDDRIDTLARVCRAIGGDELADACIGRARRDGAVNMAQYRFGLHYQADRVCRGNPEFIAKLREGGLEIVED